MKKLSRYVVFVFVLVLALGTLSLYAQMKQPKTVTISGTVIDLTCTVKAKAMSGKWVNTKGDHMMADGKINKGCAKMCLQGGQPAALFADGKILATFACNPSATLADFAGESVEIQGFWATGDSEGAKTFVPAKIRQGSDDWKDVNCATMHG